MRSAGSRLTHDYYDREGKESLSIKKGGRKETMPPSPPVDHAWQNRTYISDLFTLYLDLCGPFMVEENILDEIVPVILGSHNISYLLVT